MKHVYLLVEGPHDLEFVARVLKVVCSVQRVQKFEALDSYWEKVVPTKFPPGGDLLKRVDTPVFFQSNGISLAVHAAGGDTRIVKRVEETLSLLSPPPYAIGAILDADVKSTPQERFDAVRNGLAQLQISTPPAPGSVSEGFPRCGIFVLPDNTNQGTLEDLLIECAAESYPTLLDSARHLVMGIDPKSAAFKLNDMDEFIKNAGRKKAIVSCISAILKPGKAVQTSIQDNRWVDEKTLTLPRVALLRGFLVGLLGLDG